MQLQCAQLKEPILSVLSTLSSCSTHVTGKKRRINFTNTSKSHKCHNTHYCKYNTSIKCCVDGNTNSLNNNIEQPRICQKPNHQFATSKCNVHWKWLEHWQQTNFRQAGSKFIKESLTDTTISQLPSRSSPSFLHSTTDNVIPLHFPFYTVPTPLVQQGTLSRTIACFPSC